MAEAENPITDRVKKMAAILQAAQKVGEELEKEKETEREKAEAEKVARGEFNFLTPIGRGEG